MSAARAQHLSDRRRSEVLDVLRTLEAWGADRDWTGADPYDGLNATRLVSPFLRHKRGRQAVTQMVKRSPVNLRPLLGIGDEKTAAALAQVVSSYARDGFLPPDEGREKLERTLASLEALRCEDFEEACWGYHFDVQTRVFFYPKGAPNTIATSFAGTAILDVYEATGEKRYLDLARQVGEFFLRHVPQTEDGPGAFFGYLVGDRTPIHNANMLVCAFLARLAHQSDAQELLAAAHAGVVYTVARQRPDGSWPYGELPHLDWIDNFHSGYVLECLDVCAETGMEDLVRPALANGLDYYRRNLFLASGAPKYLPSAVYPIDVQCAAQGIQTFARNGRSNPEFREAAWKVFCYAVAELRRDDGAFIFQKRRRWQNRVPHIRWSTAPMMLALTHLLGLFEDRPPLAR